MLQFLDRPCASRRERGGTREDERARETAEREDGPRTFFVRSSATKSGEESASVHARTRWEYESRLLHLLGLESSLFRVARLNAARPEERFGVSSLYR